MHHLSTKKRSSVGELKRAVEAMKDPEQKEITECMLVVMVALEVGANVAQGTVNRVPNPNGGCTYLDAETGEVSGEWNPPSQKITHQPS